ncbi:MAG: FMN-binding protein [Lachnospiraceae bacterium]|nr:FMN-binding protein [Lachnospiraceae bacterium]
MAAFAVLCAIGLLPGRVSLAADQTGESQVYEGVGQGHNGPINLEVTVKNKKIVRIEDKGQEETPDYWEKARLLFDKIISTQHWDIDGITGASDSSDGIKEAVGDALTGVEIDQSGAEDSGNQGGSSIVAPDYQDQPEIVSNPEINPSKIFAGGNGSEDDPYLLCTSDQLRRFALSVTQDNDYQGKYIALSQDIDASQGTWIAVGQGLYQFNGTFDGGGHEIKGLHAGSEDRYLKLQKDATGYGFFGTLGQKAVVRDLILEDVSFYISGPGNNAVGGIAGFILSDYAKEDRTGALVDHCKVSGTVKLYADSFNNNTGGLIGYQVRGAVINSSSKVRIDCTVKDGSNYAVAGGLVGNQALGLTANCYSESEITGSYGAGNGGFSNIGVLCGILDGDMVNCHARGSVTSQQQTKYMGAIAGTIDEEGKAYHCYYQDKVRLSAAGTQKELIAAGYVVDKDNNEETISEDGRRYLGGVAYQLESVASLGESVANSMNDYLHTFPVELHRYSLNDHCFRSWTIDNGIAVPEGDYTIASYQLSEADVVAKDLTDGVYYGRSADKSTIVKITVKDSKISDQKVLAGDQSGSRYYDALDTAREKSEQQDVSSYGRASAEVFGGGKGTKEEPYLISKEEELRAIAESLNEDENFKGVYFLQTKDIKISGDKTWLPIGWGTLNKNKQSDEIYHQYPFCGIYQGGGHTITGLTIGTLEAAAEEGYYGGGVGLFGNIEGAEISDLSVKDTFINVKSKKKHSVNAGCLAGQTGENTKIDQVFVSGELMAEAEEGYVRIGGVVGYGGNTLMTNTISDASVSAESNGTAMAGGLYGIDTDCLTMNCVASGDINGGKKGSAGGFTGFAGGILYNCLSSGKVVGLNAGGSRGVMLGGSAVDSNCYFNKDVNVKDIGTSIGVKSAKDQQQAEGITESEMRSENMLHVLNDNNSKTDAVLEALKQNDNLNVKTILKNHYEKGVTPSGIWELKDGRLLPKFIVDDKTQDNTEESGNQTLDVGKPQEKKNTNPTVSNTASVRDRQLIPIGKEIYRIISSKSHTVELVKAKNQKRVTIPANVQYQGMSYQVTGIGKKAFAGRKIRKVVIGKKIIQIRAGAFQKSKVKSLVIKTKKLKKKSVKGCLKRSKVKTIRIKVGSKKVNKRYVKRYRKIFTKKNTGKNVSVR